MRPTLPPGALRLILWAALMTYCAGAWAWMRIDDLIHPAER